MHDLDHINDILVNRGCSDREAVLIDVRSSEMAVDPEYKLRTLTLDLDVAKDLLAQLARAVAEFERWRKPSKADKAEAAKEDKAHRAKVKKVGRPVSECCGDHVVYREESGNEGRYVAYGLYGDGSAGYAEERLDDTNSDLYGVSGLMCSGCEEILINDCYGTEDVREALADLVKEERVTIEGKAEPRNKAKAGR